MADAITIQELIDARTDAKTLEEAVNGDAVTTVLSRLGETYPTLSNALNQIDGQISDANDMLVESVTTLFTNGGLPATPFATKALMTASALVDGDYAQVTDDTVNNGLYVKTAGAWVKSGYDPLAQSDISYEYLAGNLAKVTSVLATQRALNTRLEWVYNASYTSRSMPVTPNTELYLHAIDTTVDFTRFAFFSGAEFTPAQLITYAGEVRTDAASGKKYTYVLVPANATHLVFNTRDENSEKWAIHKDAFSADLTAAEKVIVSLKGNRVHDSGALALKDVVTDKIDSGDLVAPHNILTNYRITVPKTIVYTSADNYWLLRYKVLPNEVYYARIVAPKNASGEFNDPFQAIYIKNYDSVYVADNYTALINFEPTPVKDIYKFTVPDGVGINAILIQSPRLKPAEVLAGLAPFSLQRNCFDPALVGVNREGVTTIAGDEVVDLYARSLSNVGPAAITNRLANKKVMAFGDSITQGTEGGYVDYLSRAFETNVINKGSSGAQIGRLVNMVVAGTDIGKPYPSSAEYTTAIDWTDLSCVTLMIGTNDSVFNITGWGMIPDDVPVDSVYDYANPTDYWTTAFNDTFISKMAYFIEYVQWKAPQAEFHIVLPPYVNQGDINRIEGILQYIKAVAAYYAINVIDATHESGLGFKAMDRDTGVYTYDGIHLNALGNEVFGKFLAQKVLSFG